MKGITKLSVCIATVFAAACVMSSCGGHVHQWSDWQRDENEHWRVCTVEGCNEEAERAAHVNETCIICAYGFKVLAFGFTQGGDGAHADFAREANEWFPEQGKQLGFTYDFAGTDFSKLNDETLADYDVVLFLNSRPADHDQQDALERFMKDGGAWMGFHVCAFSMDNNNEYWDWYQTDFLGCGNYAKNTWDPTSEPLHVETYDHCATKNLDLDNVSRDFENDPFWADLVLEEDSFLSAPCEWYGWESELEATAQQHVNVSLFDNDNITVLLTMNPTEENPAGDDPRPGMQWQIWTEGHYPIAWANNNYNMIYMNWGHNLQSYDLGEEGKESSTFCRSIQNQFMLDGLYGIAQKSVQQRR